MQIEDIIISIPGLSDRLLDNKLRVVAVRISSCNDLLHDGYCKDLLSSEEWKLAAKYKKMHRKQSWLAGQLAGKLAYKHLLGVCNLHSIEIMRNDKGAPYFKENQNKFISISHSDDIAIAVVSDYPIGIDIEQILERPDSFIKTWFTEKEQENLKQIPNKFKQIYSNKLWTLKEAYSKLLGIGGNLAFNSFCSIEQPAKLGIEKMSLEFQNYIFTLVWNKQISMNNG